MSRLLKPFNQSGYTLIESLFHLIISAIFLQLFVLFFFWKAPIEATYSDVNSMEWELFAIDLQKLLVEVQEIETISGNMGIQFLTGDNSIRVEKSSSVIRKRTNQVGHVPLLTGIQSVIFSLTEINLIVHVIMQDGTQRERSFAVGDYSE
ncbi:competence type IV pilus minor pilin ComGF [Sporosarcina sp. FA9]|uniref:competence type IV pilus minor pilin ComGF n=1 Tax=Sporosarcina sp. FA9 TaxID=3413030 RepID=UPI003F66053C